MDKYLILLSSLVIFKLANGLSIELPDYLKGPARILHETCQQETGVAEELIQTSRNGVLQKGRELECYIHCLFEKSTLYDEKGHIKFESIYHLIPTEIKEKIDAVTAVCSTIHGKDACETAYLTVQCYFEADPENSILI